MRLVSILFILLFSTIASAQDINELTPAERKQLEADLTSAQESYESGNFEAAKIALEKVYKQLPDPDVLYRLALCYERLGEDQKAIDAYQRYLAARPNDRDKARIEGVVRALKERSKSTTATLTVVLKPVDARLYIDGAERIEPNNADGEKVIQIGEGAHEISVQRDGFVAEERNVNLSPDQTYNLIIALAPIPESNAKSTIGWILAGTGVTAIATGATLLGISMGMNDVLDASYDTRSDSLRPSNFDDLESRHNTFVIAGWSTVGAGFALAGLGTYFLLSTGKEKDVAIAPVISSDGVQIGATARF